MFLQFDGNGALYAQLARALKRAILQGQLKAGAALPATRALAAELGLSRNTVLTAYERRSQPRHATPPACGACRR